MTAVWLTSTISLALSIFFWCGAVLAITAHRYAESVIMFTGSLGSSVIAYVLLGQLVR